MGNTGSTGRWWSHNWWSNPPPQPEVTASGNQFAAAEWSNERHPFPVVPPQPLLFEEHYGAMTIRNDVNVNKETLRIEPDEEHPGNYLVAFTFDATISGSITIIFFAKEGQNCSLVATKESLLPSVTMHFQQGLGQKFRQASGTGISLSMFEEGELSKHQDMDIYPLTIKADGFLDSGSQNSQITQAVFEKDKTGYHVQVVTQILWVNRKRYELQELFGIESSLEGQTHRNYQGKECVVCLSEPPATTIVPCRHMCMCSECAIVLRLHSNRCPICRQQVGRLLELKASSNGANEEG